MCNSPAAALLLLITIWWPCQLVAGVPVTPQGRPLAGRQNRVAAPEERSPSALTLFDSRRSPGNSRSHPGRSFLPDLERFSGSCEWIHRENRAKTNVSRPWSYTNVKWGLYL